MLTPRTPTVETRRRGAPKPAPVTPPAARVLARIVLTPEQAVALKKMLALRKAFLHTVNKHKYTCYHPKWGNFDLWLEDGDTLPVVIDGIAGVFRAGRWTPIETALPTQEQVQDEHQRKLDIGHKHAIARRLRGSRDPY